MSSATLRNVRHRNCNKILVKNWICKIGRSVSFCNDEVHYLLSFYNDRIVNEETHDSRNWREQILNHIAEKILDNSERLILLNLISSSNVTFKQTSVMNYEE